MRKQYHYLPSVRVCDVNFTLTSYASEGWQVHTISEPQGAVVNILLERDFVSKAVHSASV